MDPPYEKGLIKKTLMKLNSQRIYHKDSILVIEHGRREPLPDIVEGWNLIRQRKIGDTLISFLIPRLESPTANAVDLTQSGTQEVIT